MSDELSDALYKAFYVNSFRTRYHDANGNIITNGEWSNGVCKPKKPEPTGCTSDEDCEEGEFCDFGNMDEKPDGDMAPVGKCKPRKPEPTECFSDQDCDEGEFCDFEDGADTPPNGIQSPPGVCKPKKPEPKACFSD